MARINICFNCGKTRRKIRFVAPYIPSCYMCTPRSWEKRTAWKSGVFEKSI
ncbi:MAG: hypothetical protein HY438_03285 [DPANN group archaeon]|nr:hypothetical protein [DPANN group archaeon]